MFKFILYNIFHIWNRLPISFLSYDMVSPKFVNNIFENRVSRMRAIFSQFSQRLNLFNHMIKRKACPFVGIFWNRVMTTHIEAERRPRLSLRISGSHSTHALAD